MILVSDFDGTLKRQDVTKKDLQAIEEFRRQGHIFAIATGRPFHFLQQGLSRYHVPSDFIIATNGGLIKNKEVIFLSKISYDTMMNLAMFLAQYEDSELIVSNGLDYSHPIQQISDLEQARGIPGLQETFFNEASIIHATVDMYSSLIDEQSSREFQDIDFLYNTYGAGVIDVVQKGVSKSAAISKVFIEELNYQKSDIYVIGNSLNDLDMIRDFKGFAVSDCDEKLLEYTSAIFPDVSTCIEYLLSLN